MSRVKKGLPAFCTFCRNNGEIPEFYRSHKLKDENCRVTCPVLKLYTCPKCQKVGRHTVSYCPLNRAGHFSLSKQVQDENEASLASNRKPAPFKPDRGRVFGKPRAANQQQEPDEPAPGGVRMRNLAECYARPLALDFKLPPINREGGSLEEKWFRLLLRTANDMPANDRSQFFLDHDYNPKRFEYIRQAAYIANYMIMIELSKAARQA